MSRLSDDEKRYFTDQISMLKGENERLTDYIELIQAPVNEMPNHEIANSAHWWKEECEQLKAENERLKRNIYWSRMELEGHYIPWNGEFQFDHEQGLAWFVTKAELDSLFTPEKK